MKKILIFTVLTVILGITACNRFEDSLGPEVSADSLFVSFVNDFETDIQNAVNSSNLNTILSFYSDDYMNQGYMIDDVEAFYNNIFNETDVVVEAEVLVSTEKFSCRFYSQSSRLDTTIVDFVKQNGSSFIITGDGVNPEPYDTFVLVEFFTARTCSSCPNAAAKLHELESVIDGKFAYIEYNTLTDPAENYSAKDYYGFNQWPTVTFNGINSITGGTATQTDTYEPQIRSAANKQSAINIENVTASANGTTVSGSVDIVKANQSLISNPVLVVYLVEKVSDVKYLSNQENLTNVVIGGKKIDITDFNQTIDFSFTTQNDIPDDVHLIIYVQNMPDSYNGSESMMFQTLQYELN